MIDEYIVAAVIVLILWSILMFNFGGSGKQNKCDALEMQLDHSNRASWELTDSIIKLKRLQKEADDAGFENADLKVDIERLKARLNVLQESCEVDQKGNGKIKLTVAVTQALQGGE
tara:strand:+ start:441 stop:788 length:348 start_codon:yes stop_codon:yes gene_type:complete